MAILALGLVQPLRAGDSKDAKATPEPEATPEEEPKNWIELGIGGLIINGDAAQFKQEHRMSGDIYGGIQDFHYENSSLPNDIQLEADGHAIFDNNDYDVKVKISKAKLGYLAAGFNEFRSFYDGNGGFFPHHNVWFDPQFDEMHIDRREAWVEMGLQIPDWPEIIVHYSHLERFGMKDSTVWGDTNLTQGPLPTPPPSTTNPGLTNNPTRKIAPAFRDIDETRDVFALDATKTWGNTDVSIGMRYEHDDLNNSLNLERGAGQLFMTAPNVSPGQQRFITQKDSNSVDIWNGHVSEETRLSDTVWFTSAYSYNSLGADLSGSRILGLNYNSMFGNFPTLQSNDHAILNLAGASDTEEHVFNANLFWMPDKDLNILFGFRYTNESTTSDSTFLDFNTTANVAPFTPSNPSGAFHYLNPVPKSADTFDNLNNFDERLELRYTKIQNWLFYVEGEWVEEFGDVHEHEFGGSVSSKNVLTAQDQGTMSKDNYLMGQKYSAGATWYPLAYLNMAAQYYYKIADYDNDFHSELATPSDSVPSPAGSERNQRLLGQDWDTQDANIRVTYSPKVPACLGTVTFVTRYDFMQTSISGKWAVSPAGPSPTPAPTGTAALYTTGTVLNEERTGIIFNNVLSEAVNWNPLPRLYFQGNFSYTWSQTNTPVGKTDLIATGTLTYPSPSVVNFRNDYWTVTAGGGYIIDDKTEVRSDYTFYRAADYSNYAGVGMPYGMGATEHTVSAQLTRQIAKNVRLLFRYNYYTYEDQTSGNHNNYEAHSFYSGLQVRF